MFYYDQQIYYYFRNGQWDQAEELIRAHPDIVKKDRSLLCDALWYESPHSLVRALIETDPEQAKTKDYYEGYPLHNAIANNHQSDIILFILDAYPDAAKEKDSIGQYPIHIAVQMTCSLEVITKLVNAYEDGLSKEYVGDLPLHIAMNRKYDSSMLLYLIEKYPQAVSCERTLSRVE